MSIGDDILNLLRRSRLPLSTSEIVVVVKTWAFRLATPNTCVWAALRRLQQRGMIERFTTAGVYSRNKHRGPPSGRVSYWYPATRVYT